MTKVKRKKLVIISFHLVNGSFLRWYDTKNEQIAFDRPVAFKRSHPVESQLHIQTHLVRTRFRNESQIGDVDGLLQGALVRSIEKSIERNVLEDLVDSEFVGIEKHDLCCCVR